MLAEAAGWIGKAPGWIGNGCFFSRFFLQWLSSERARRPVVPASFWWFSVAGAVGLSLTALISDRPLLLVGYALNGAIAVRNLVLSQRGPGSGADARLGLVALVVLLVALALSLRELSASESAPWLATGAVGTLFIGARFPVQWWISERTGVVHFPVAFWWMSLIGTFCMLAYTLHLGEAVFWVGYVLNPIVQVRNLMLGRRAARAT